MAEKKGVWNGVPPIVKGIIYLTATAGVVWGTVEITKAIKKSKAKKGSKEELKDINKELNDLNSKPSTKQTISPSTAKAIANNLFTAMDGYGTDSLVITKNLLKLQNQADWLAVRSAYGIREISSGKFNPAPNYIGTLEGALSDELGLVDSSVTPTLNRYFKAKKIDLKL